MSHLGKLVEYSRDITIYGWIRMNTEMEYQPIVKEIKCIIIKYIVNDNDLEVKITKYDTKIAIVGAKNIGKSTLISNYFCSIINVSDKYHAKSMVTNGSVFTAKVTEINTHVSNDELTSHDSMFCYSATNSDSFLEIQKVKDNFFDDGAMILVALQCDDRDRIINEEMGQQIAKEWRCSYIEVSSFNNINVNEVFKTLIESRIKYVLKREDEEYLRRQQRRKRNTTGFDRFDDSFWCRFKIFGCLCELTLLILGILLLSGVIKGNKGVRIGFGVFLLIICCCLPMVFGMIFLIIALKMSFAGGRRYIVDGNDIRTDTIEMKNNNDDRYITIYDNDFDMDIEKYLKNIKYNKYNINNIDKRVRYKLIKKYKKDGISEYMSIYSFIKVINELKYINAPQYLINLAINAKYDEIKHTKYLFEIVNILNNSNNNNNKIYKPNNIKETTYIHKNIFDILYETFELGCIEETISLYTMYYESKNITQDSSFNIRLKSILNEIINDEINHSALAWTTIKWIINTHNITHESKHELKQIFNNRVHKVKHSNYYNSKHNILKCFHIIQNLMNLLLNDTIKWHSLSAFHDKIVYIIKQQL